MEVDFFLAETQRRRDASLLGYKVAGFKGCGLRVAGWNADEADGFAKADLCGFFLVDVDFFSRRDEETQGCFAFGL